MSDEPRKSPEAAPEGPGTTSGSPGSDGGRWITATEAARLVGRSERGTRDWLERHGIPARGDRPRLFSEAAIRAELPAPAPEAPGSASGTSRSSPEAAPEAPGSGSGTSGEPIEVPYRVDGEAPAALVPLSTMLVELGHFADRIERLAREASEERQRRIQAEAERDELRARVAALEAEQAAAEAAEFAARVDPEPSAAVGADDLEHAGRAETPEKAATGRPGVFRRWWAWLAGGSA